METKVCTKCPENGEQPVSSFYPKRNVCKKCHDRYWNAKKKEQGKRVNPIRPSGYFKALQRDNKKKYHRSKELLTNRYIKSLLERRGILCKSDITQEMIDLKRKQIKLQRYAKAIKENQCH
jgi:hypothetical protein